MPDQQLELGEFEIPEQELRRAYDRGGIEGFSFEHVMGDPLLKRLLEWDVKLNQRHHKVRRERRE